MKKTIALSAITILAVFALAGCNQNTPGVPTDAQATNSSVSNTNGLASGMTNKPTTINLPDLNTNLPAITNQ